jgi:hypothetical protein
MIYASGDLTTSLCSLVGATLCMTLIYCRHMFYDGEKLSAFNTLILCVITITIVNILNEIIR